jgi:hypothetical protein
VMPLERGSRANSVFEMFKSRQPGLHLPAAAANWSSPFQGPGGGPRHAFGDWSVQRWTARLKALISSEYPNRSAISENGKWRCFMPGSPASASDG